jgi:uncharacterized protein
MVQFNRALVQGVYDSFLNGDVDGVLARLDANVEWRTPGGAALPTAGVRVGREQVREFFELLATLFDFEDFRIDGMLADGDRVVVLGADTTTIKGTGVRIPTTWAHVYTIRDGRVMKFDEYLDTSAIAAEYHRAALRV